MQHHGSLLHTQKKRHTGAEVVDIDESETKRQILLVSLGLFFWSEMM